MIDATGMPQTAVVVGGSSEIALEIVRALASRRLDRVVLAGRDPARLEAAAATLRERGVAEVSVEMFDAATPEAADGLAARASAALGQVDLCLIALGDLGTAELDALDSSRVAAMMAANVTAPAAAATAFARVMVEAGSGRIVGLSSVAGLRVRRSNFAYGAGKAGFDGFLSGLGEAVRGTGVKVTIVRPGFVRTKMTKGLPDAPFTIDPLEVATAVVTGLETDADIVYVPSVLEYVFALLRLLPAAVWRRLPG
jgi:decaprenylphospho-beta-D-erythro-pentofuranosid-2-ulose 2-reductase